MIHFEYPFAVNVLKAGLTGLVSIGNFYVLK